MMFLDFMACLRCQMCSATAASCCCCCCGCCCPPPPGCCLQTPPLKASAPSACAALPPPWCQAAPHLPPSPQVTMHPTSTSTHWLNSAQVSLAGRFHWQRQGGKTSGSLSELWLKLLLLLLLWLLRLKVSVPILAAATRTAKLPPAPCLSPCKPRG
jgi:hypothetical protein